MTKTQAASLTPEHLHLFETVPDLYLILSSELTILTASDAYLEATFQERETIRGEHIFRIFPDNPELADSDGTLNLRHSLEWVLHHKKPHQMALQLYDVMHPTKTGRFAEKYWVPSNTPVLDREGNILYIIHKVQDMTEQVQSKLQFDAYKVKIRSNKKASEVRQSQVLSTVELQRDLLQTLLDQAPVAMCLFKGPDQVITSANQLMCEMWGRTAEQVLGKPLLAAVPELEGQQFDQLIREVYNTGVPFTGKEHQATLLRNGVLETFYFNSVYQPLYNEQKQLLGVVDVAVDVTEMVKARMKVEQNEHQLQVLNKELSAANAETSASMEEMLVINEELLHVQQELKKLNRNLEQRVEDRTRELQQAKAETESERNRLYSLFMQAPAPTVILESQEFIFKMVNPAYQQIFPGRELLGKALLEAIPEVVNTPIPGILEQVYRTGKTFVAKEMPLMLSRHKGAPPEELICTFTYQARTNEKGETDGVFVFAHDITEQVRERQEVERSAEKLRLITDALPVLIGYLDKQEKYCFTNKAYETWFNIGPEQLLGRPVREVIGEKAYAGVKQFIDRALAGERLSFESRMPYREGFIRYTHTSYVPDVQGSQVVGFYTLVSDVTEQVEARHKVEAREKEAQVLARELKAANEELSGSLEAFQDLALQQQRLVALVENSTDFISLLSPTGDGVFINQGGLKLTGLQEAQVQELNIINFFRDEDKHFAREAILQPLLEKGRWVGEFRICHFQTKQTIPVYLNCFTIKDPETEELLGIAVIMIDITTRKKQEEELQAMSSKLSRTNTELRTANEQLTRTNIDLDNFIYAASHDLKAPILNIEGLTQLMVDLLPAHVMESQGLGGVTSMIQESIERFKRTIDHLTEVTKLQKEHNQKAVLVDIRGAVQEVQLDLATQLASTGTDLEIDMENCPSGIHFSQKNLRSVVYNLLSNAIKYASPERSPEIKISCRTEGDYVLLSVKDNGLGINLPKNPKLFSMFGRLHDHVEGTGIGLYMVKKIVENADGRIEVESKEGVGSTFTVYLKK